MILQQLDLFFIAHSIALVSRNAFYRCCLPLASAGSNLSCRVFFRIEWANLEDEMDRLADGIHINLKRNGTFEAEAVAFVSMHMMNKR